MPSVDPTFRRLAAGTGLYAAALVPAVPIWGQAAIAPLVGPVPLLTPLFGLPLVVASWRQAGRWRRLGYYLVALTLVHEGANFLAMMIALSDGTDLAASRPSLWLAGAAGGGVGAALSMLALPLAGLARWRRVGSSDGAAAVLALAGAGAVLMPVGLLLSGASGDAALIVWIEIVVVPWQLGFAWFLARLQRPAAT